VKGESNLEEFPEEGYDSKSVVLPMMMMMIVTYRLLLLLLLVLVLPFWQNLVLFSVISRRRQ
jgi:hypothetical protein